MRYSMLRAMLAVAIGAVIMAAMKYRYESGPPYSWERWLVDSKASVRETAADELARMGPDATRSIPVLIDALVNDPSPGVRKHCAIGLYSILPRSGSVPIATRRSVLSALLKGQTDGDPAVRAATAVGLSVLRADPSLTGPALLRGARDGDEWGRASAVSELAYGLPPEWHRRNDVQAAILSALGDSSPHVRERAGNSYLVVSEHDPSIFDEALRTKDARVRRTAVEAIERNGLRAAAAYPFLIPALNDPDPDVRNAVKRGLSAAIPDPNLQIPGELVSALTNPDAIVRTAAIVALGKFGTRAKVALRPLRRAQNDPDPAVRQAAVEVVHAIERNLGEVEATVLHCIDELDDAEPTKRARAADDLRRLGPPARIALPALDRVISGDSNSDVRESAARAKDAIIGTE